MIDLRSDTVSMPTPAMRKAMAEAVVGDDVYSEDPTVNRLQEMGAAMLGKEAALFVPSGTMGNLAAVLAHCGRGDEVIMGDLGHTFLFEAGGISALGGVHPHTLPNQPDGTLNLAAVRGAIRSDNIHHPVSRLLILENTHNRCGGVPVSEAYTEAAGDLAHEHDLMLHLDGARIFNAAAALSVKAAALAAPADSVTFCLSKALCAPVGSLLCGSQAFIGRARRIRKQLGGGMRQAGVLAAAGIVALEQMVDRLGEDHIRARRLAEEIACLPGMRLSTGMPQSNMVFLEMDQSIPYHAEQVAEQLSQMEIRVGTVGPRHFRLVTHYWIDDQAVEAVVAGFKQVLQPV